MPKSGRLDSCWGRVRGVGLRASPGHGNGALCHGGMSNTAEVDRIEDQAIKIMNNELLLKNC